MHKSLVILCKYVPNAVKLGIGAANVDSQINTIVMRKDIEKTTINLLRI